MTIARRILKPFFYMYLYIFRSRMAARKLKYLTDGCGNDFEQLVNVAYSFEYELNFPKSWLVSLKPA